MRRVVIGFAVGLLLLAAVVAVRTARFAAGAGRGAAPVANATPAAEVIAAHLGEAVRFRTISVSDTAPPPAAELAGLRDFLERTYPRTHATLSREIVDEGSLLYTWKGRDASLPPVVLMAHLDVVPVEAGTESRWTHPPFSGAVADGFVWGRGTLDDKVNAIVQLEAVERLLSDGLVPRRTILLAFGHNEEVKGSGAQAIVALLALRGLHPALVVDEGGAVAEGMFPGVDGPLAIVGTAEKGFQSVELVVDGAGGHSSMPPRETAAGIVAAGVVKLERHPLEARLTPGVRAMLEHTGRRMSIGRRAVFANLWLFRPLVMRLLAAQPQTDALIRTTTAPTMLEGSAKENVLPERARAVVNFRILPGDTIAGVVDHVRRTVDDPRIAVRAFGDGAEPSPVSPDDGPEFAVVERSIREAIPGTDVTPFLVTAATDARHYSAIAKNVLRFSPYRLRGGADRERLHGSNERVPVADLPSMVGFYMRLVANTQEMR